MLAGGILLWRYEPATDAATEVDASRLGSVREHPTDTRPSIAVLPFENRSRLEDDAFFVDGIHDDILTQVSKLSALKVISRDSVERLRGAKLSTREIAEQLGVTSVLQGGVQRAGDRVRIRVWLIDASTDTQLWADSFDRELSMDNLFAMQSEVAAAIAGALQAKLTPAERARLSAAPTKNLEAWQAYQLARKTRGAAHEHEPGGSRAALPAGDRPRSELRAGLRRPGEHHQPPDPLQRTISRRGDRPG